MRESRREFCNEPPIDFSRAENRVRFAESLEEVRDEFKKQRKPGSGSWLESVNPANPNEVIGRVRTVDASKTLKRRSTRPRAFFPNGATRRRKSALRFSIKRRKSCAKGAGNSLLGRFSKSAKAGARRTPTLSKRSTISIIMPARCCAWPSRARRNNLPSETNVYFYEPRGIAAIIAPWNFPLAILTGMTAAALVTGNCVLMKPAEQSPVMGCASSRNFP